MTIKEFILSEIDNLKDIIEKSKKLSCETMIKACEEYIEQYSQILNDLEVLDEIRKEIKVIDYGEEYQNRYAIQYIERGQVVIVELCKEDYDKWNRWLDNGQNKISNDK